MARLCDPRLTAEVRSDLAPRSEPPGESTKSLSPRRPPTLLCARSPIAPRCKAPARTVEERTRDDAEKAPRLVGVPPVNEPGGEDGPAGEAGRA